MPVHKSFLNTVCRQSQHQRAQFVNVIESVFSGMARAVIHNSVYKSVEDCFAAINRHFKERNQKFKEIP